MGKKKEKSDKLTRSEVINIARRSKHPSVVSAFEKLEFAIMLAHGAGELEKLSSLPTFHLRIGRKDDNTYEHIVVSWCEDQFVVSAPNDTVSGEATDTNDDPALVYLRG